MFLFFHINAIGKPKKWNVPASDTYFWPRLLQIAWQQYDKHGEILQNEDFIIKPEGFEIPVEIEHFTKITPNQAHEEGVALDETLKKFSKLVDESKYIIAHNMKLAANVVEAECIRKNIPSRLMASEQYSLMQEATYFCKIPARGGTKYKWPTLQEIHQRCYNSKFADGHDAKVSVQALANCFFFLVKKEEIDLF
jgi:DNA polymerase-3 subunit alpha